MNRTRALSLSTYLMLLVLSIIVPAAIISAGLVWRSGVLDRERVSVQALQLARSAAHLVDLDIEGSLETLAALGASPALLRGDLAAFYRQAKETMKLRGLNILVRDLTGQQVLNTRVPWGTALPVEVANDAHRQLVESFQTLEE